MKKLVFIAATLAATTFAKAQATICDGFMLMEKGVTLVYKDYDAKEKLTGSQSSTITDITQSGNVVTVTVHQVSKDAKDKITDEGDVIFTCENGEVKIDMKSMVDQRQMEGFKEYDLTIEQTNLVFPSTLSEGLKLPDGSMTMNVSSAGTHIMKFVMNITERNVEKQESITTPAGTFDTYKTTATIRTEMPMVKSTTKTISWIAKGFGVIRTEAYSEKGDLRSVRVLAEIIR